MALPSLFPTDSVTLSGVTASIATTPVSINFVSPLDGYISRGYVNAFGTTTGTVTAAVKVNGGATDVFNGALTLPAGAGTLNNPGVLSNPVSTANPATVRQGDAIVVSFSGGTGASIPGAVSLVISPSSA